MQLIKELVQQKKVIVIGSGQQCDWQIQDFLIDEKHCQLSAMGADKYLIVDLGSQHGTFVNNEKITHKEINELDFISIGAKIFQLKSAYDIGQTEANQPKGDEKVNQANQQQSSSSQSTSDSPKQSTQEQTKSSNTNNKVLSIYCLYASEDEAAAVFLDKHLAALKHSQTLPIQVIGHFNRRAGDDRSNDIELLKNANIILVFISADLISNEQTYNKTMMAIENHNKNKSLLLPILTRRCMWKDMPFSQLNLLPKNQEPLYSKKSWENEDESFTNVVSEIKNAINVFYKKEQEYKEGKSESAAFTTNTPLKTDFRAGYFWGIFWKRTFAYILDSLIIYIPIMLILFLFNPESIDYETGNVSIGQTFITFVAAILVFSYFESSNSMASPGKKILGLVITDEKSEKLTFQKALIRNLIKYAILFFTTNPVLSVLYIIGQIAFYAAKHQFFQDTLSKTIISPKLKRAY
ncbi:MAG: RDD family protein [Bacteroidetes bacterium]|nr:RDD family protein [Bacteroidota bacterium]